MTFIQIVGTGSTPAHGSATSASGWGSSSTGSPLNNHGVLSWGGQGNSGLTFWANATTITVPRTGVYVVYATLVTNGVGGFQLNLPGGSATITGSPLSEGQGGGLTADQGLFWMGTMPVGGALTIGGAYYFGVPTGAAMQITFVPTPTYR